jgi:hypothetical protein
VSSVLAMGVKPVWDEVDAVRGETTRFLHNAGMSRDVVDAVTMVVGELTENANKYGSFTQDGDRISVTVTVGGKTITIEVKHPVAPESRPDLERMDRLIQWIRSFQDPFEAYTERIKAVSSEGMAAPSSGLGLTRVAYEGQSILDFFLDPDERLTVAAVYPLH